MTPNHTADVCDTHPEKVQVLAPDYQHFGGTKHCQGKLITVKLEQYNGALLDLLRDEDGTGTVVVVDVNADYVAVVGEKLMTLAWKNNYQGLIINGYVRDTEQIQSIPVVLMALGTCPRKAAQVKPGQRQLDLHFGGVNFVPGEYVYTDHDGAIIMPSSQC